MKKIIVIPDSFKGTMTSKEVCDIETVELSRALPGVEVLAVPIADGGEGTVECFLRTLPGRKITVEATDAFGNTTRGYYGSFQDFAVVEMATVSGIVSNSRRDPMNASTYGTGQLIRSAVEKGARKILIGLGGSCTNDGGAGMAAALGTRFYDKEGKSFIPAGCSLEKVERIDNNLNVKLLKGIELSCMCDIENPLYGPEGAAYVFAPQKGADREQVRILDRNLRAFAKTVKRELGVDISSIAGGGAAGGMGAGAKAFLGAELRRGIDYILDLIEFDSKLEDCDCVITGEGKLDSQSLGGKVIKGVAERAGRKGVPVIAVVGAISKELEGEYGKSLLRKNGIEKVYVTSEGRRSYEEIMANCRYDLRKTINMVAADCR